MILYRFAHEKYATDLSGEGARLYGGRWNSRGTSVVYTSTTISLSLLELLIHSVDYNTIKSNMLLTIEAPDDNLYISDRQAFKRSWQNDNEYSSYMGDNFVRSQQTLLMQVPSAIIPEEHNVLLNPLHPGIKKVKIISCKKFVFDNRLFH